MYINSSYIIKTKTNLHVGSGDTNFSIVDKQVQRDSISQLPVINASSLKGAIRDHMHEFIAPNNETIDNEVKPFAFRSIFGSEENNLNDDDKKIHDKLPKQGLVKFLDAQLLFVPMRSNKKPYYHVTSAETFNNAIENLKHFDIIIDVQKITEPEKSKVIDSSEALVEDVECIASTEDFSSIKELFGIYNLAIFTEDDFSEILQSLPVIARNNLVNGKSTNLWYEEVVPRESIFLSTLCYYNCLDESDKVKFKTAFTLFEKKLLQDHIQIGANASIGYGITTFKNLGESYEQQKN